MTGTDGVTGGAPAGGAATDAEARLESIAPGYLATVRSAASRLAARDDGPDTVRDALADAAELARIDVEIPTDASTGPARLLKRVVRRLTRWYFGYVAAQITALAEALLRVAGTLADRADDQETASRALAAKLDGLTERVEELERRSGA